MNVRALRKSPGDGAYFILFYFTFTRMKMDVLGMD